MAERTMTERDMLLQTWEDEFEITKRVLCAVPPDKIDYRPHEKSRTVGELGWNFVIGECLIVQGTKGQLDVQKIGVPPTKWQEILTAFEDAHRESGEILRGAPPEVFDQTMPFPIRPGEMGERRRGEVLWLVVMDSVHHRGQLSVYLRLVGAKVPSIYGPTADEPWS